jgi:hypothetical protein
MASRECQKVTPLHSVDPPIARCHVILSAYPHFAPRTGFGPHSGQVILVDHIIEGCVVMQPAVTKLEILAMLGFGVIRIAAMIADMFAYLSSVFTLSTGSWDVCGVGTC